MRKVRIGQVDLTRGHMSLIKVIDADERTRSEPVQWPSAVVEMYVDHSMIRMKN